MHLFKSLFLSLLCLLVFCDSQLYAQKVKAKGIQIRFRNYPEFRIHNEDYKSYVVSFQNELLANGEAAMIRNEIVIPSLEKSKKDEADLQLRIRLSKRNIISNKLVEKRDNGKTVGYSYLIKYTAPITYFLMPMHQEGYFLTNEILTETLVYRTPPQPTKAYLKAIYKNGVTSRDLNRNYMTYVNNHFKELFGSEKEYFFVEYYTAKGKKINYDVINDILKSLKKDVFKETVNHSLSAEKSQIVKGYIEDLKKELEQVDFTDDDARINKEVSQGLYYNLSMLSAFALDFKNAWEYFGMLEDYLYVENIAKLEKFLLNYENSYNMSSGNRVDFRRILSGKWELVGLVGDESHDIDGDGVAHIDYLNKEFKNCEKNVSLHFFGNKEVDLNSMDSFCKPIKEHFTWKTFSSKVISTRSFAFVGIGDEYDEMFDELWEIKKINSKQFSISGHAAIVPGYDTSAKVTYTFMKVEE